VIFAGYPLALVVLDHHVFNLLVLCHVQCHVFNHVINHVINRANNVHAKKKKNAVKRKNVARKKSVAKRNVFKLIIRMRAENHA
jgi:hypothetical protein